MKIKKSTRHAKITGDFGEALVLYWLSKYGFECAAVDHTGIDIIARNPHTKEVMGISVMRRSRNEGAEEDLDRWLHHYNYERPHRGYRNMGRRPIDTIEAGKIIKEQETLKQAT
jgi:transposase InsO family protein